MIRENSVLELGFMTVRLRFLHGCVLFRGEIQEENHKKLSRTVALEDQGVFTNRNITSVIFHLCSIGVTACQCSSIDGMLVGWRQLHY